MGIPSNPVQVYAFLGVHHHRCDLVFILGWATERNPGFFGDIGDILDELGPGLLPFRSLPAMYGVIVRVTCFFFVSNVMFWMMDGLTPWLKMRVGRGGS